MNKTIKLQQLIGLTSIIPILIIALYSCTPDKDEFDSPKMVTHEIVLHAPLNLKNIQLIKAKTILTNIRTNKKYIIKDFKQKGNDFITSFQIPQGLYNIEVVGSINNTINENKIQSTVKAQKDDVKILSDTGEDLKTEISLTTYSAKDGLVISEIFFTGTTTPAGFMYTDDQYIKIGNNSDTTMYADGVAFIESFFTSDDKHDYKPDIMNEAMTIVAIYVIPGSGKDVPIKPGKEITIALTAIDHRPINPNSFDLSKAEFEIYDKTSHIEGDRDNPKVPNLINWYANFSGTFVMHTRGVKSYAIAKPMVDMKTYMTKYRYRFGYIFRQGDIVVPMNEYEYYMPNQWIIDAVSLAVPTVHEWNLVSPVLDKGFTYCGHVDFDETRYNKSVIRKKEGNKWIDTNNSTNDFIPNAVPSYLRNKK